MSWPGAITNAIPSGFGGRGFDGAVRFGFFSFT